MPNKKQNICESSSVKYKNMFHAYAAFWRRGFTEWRGTSSRSEYWWSAFINFIIMVIFGCAASVILTNLDSELKIVGISAIILGVLFIAFIAAVFIPSVSIVVRRFHDAGFNSWWLLMYLLLFIRGLDILISLIILVIMLLPTAVRCNPYHKFNKK